jgi:hypothetical protein
MAAGPGNWRTSTPRDGSRPAWNGVTTMTKPNARIPKDPSETGHTAPPAREEQT